MLLNNLAVRQHATRKGEIVRRNLVLGKRNTTLWTSRLTPEQELNSRLFNGVNSFENIINIRYFLNKDDEEGVILLKFRYKINLSNIEIGISRAEAIATPSFLLYII
jgi:hypothetical protein